MRVPAGRAPPADSVKVRVAERKVPRVTKAGATTGDDRREWTVARCRPMLRHEIRVCLLPVPAPWRFEVIPGSVGAAAVSSGRHGSPPRVSIILVSDYARGGRTWADRIAAVQAFLADALLDPGGPFEIIVMEPLPASGIAPAVPPALAALAPRVRVIFDRSHRSSVLKDAGLEHCRGELIAVVEADCVAEPGWLRRLVAAMDADPALDVANGRTTYGMHSAMRRVATLLDRGYLERRQDGRHVHVSNNGALYRRSVLERYPYPDEASPFVSAELRNIRMRAGGVKIGVEPTALMRHGYGGIPFMVDLRRNKGFQAARMIARRSPRHARRSAFRLALAAAKRGAREDLATILSLGRQFLRWTDWPLLVLVFLAARLPEFAGALSVHSPKRFAARTAYR